MQQKELGDTGVVLPEVGIGTWNHSAGLGPLLRGVEAGAAFLDTGESYGTEELVGEVARSWREPVFIATKVSPQNFRAAAFRNTVEASLRRLGVERIDLLQLHRPNSQVPIAETMRAMEQAIDAGKVRFAGVSNFSVAQLREAQAAFGKYRIVSNQVRYNLIDRTIEKDLLPYCREHRISVIAYSPLARGLGRIADCDPSGVVAEVARATGKTPAQVALNWCLAEQPVAVIPGANSVPHVLENCGASGWRLSPEHLALLNARIQFRHRGRFDQLVRKHMPRNVERLAIQILNRLPRGLRRRLT